MKSLGRIAVSIFLLFILACASVPRENFDKVHVGMYKGDVLDIAGSPVSSVYKNGEYIWLYRFYEGDTKSEKEIRLKNDSVTYVGDVQKTPSKNNFDKIQVGMKKEEVLDLVGFPKRVENKNKSEVWTYEDGHAVVISDNQVKSITHH